MAKVETGRFDEFLRGLFGIAGEWVAPLVCSELVPVVVAQGENATHHFARRERIVSWAGYGGAVAAQYSQLRIRNEVSSNFLIEVQLVTVSFTASDRFRITLSELAGDLGTLGSAPTVRDTRLAPFQTAGVPGPSAIITSLGSAVAVPTTNVVHRMQSLANQSTYYPMPIVLAPGSELTVTKETVNTAIYANFDWLEIPLSPKQMA